MEKRTITYLGGDFPFAKEIKRYYKQALEGDLVTVNTIELKEEKWQEVFFTQSLKKPPHILFVDFVNLTAEKEKELYLFLEFVTSTYTFRTLPLIGLFKERNDLLQRQYLLGCGLIYCGVKGNRDESWEMILRDSLFIGFENSIHFPKYAIAENINIEYSMQCLGLISRISNSTIFLETDIYNTSARSVAIDFNLFDDFTPKNFAIEEQLGTSLYRRFMYTWKAAIPYPGPWDEESDSTIAKETMETWLDLNRPEFKHYLNNVLIYDSRDLIWPDILKYNQDGLFKITYQQFLLKDSEKFSQIRPFLIIWRLNPDEEIPYLDTENYYNLNTGGLFQLINHIKTIDDYNPYVIIFNSKSKSKAFQKTLQYMNVLSFPKDLEFSTARGLLDKYKEICGDDYNPSTTNFFPIGDHRQLVHIKTPILITSLTEHEITFCSATEIPLYSLVKISDPMELILTVIPSTKQLEIKTYGKHYMAFITSADQTDLKILRQFVNYCIQSPLKEFKYIPPEPEKKKSKDGDSDADIEKDEDSIEVAASSTPMTQIESFEVQRKFSSGMKSKL